MKLLAIIGLLWFGWLIGWVHAHLTVASECERLGAFFVGKTVYRCTSIEPKDESRE
ncbi:hypothetical protein [Stutzerimonas stutzeri]|uniref:hypothetical protein n=1 Tax=Stutzerimonas stutzeri TaxID=316 RepID=UPI001BD1045A|nr:hypothetical protein [Stutzerimonas stutzeri]